MNRISEKPKRKKKIIISIILVVLVIIGFVIFNTISKQASGETKYTMGAVTKDMFIKTLSGGGQVYASNQYDIKSKVSTTITDVLKKNGDKVKKGDIILKLDSSDLSQQLRSAQNNLANAELNYQKAIAPADAVSLAQAQSSLQSAKDNLEKLKSSQITNLSSANDAVTNAQISVSNSYATTLNNIDTAFAGFNTIINDSQQVLYLTDTLLPQDITGNSTTDQNLIDINAFWNVTIPKYWQDILNSTNFDSDSDKQTLQTLIQKATIYYKNAQIIYGKNVIDYRNLNKTSSNDQIKAFLDEAIATSQSISDCVRGLNNVYGYYIDYSNQRHRTLYSSINSYNNTLKTDTISATNYLSSLTSSKTGSNGIYGAESNYQDAVNALNSLKQTQPMDLSAAQNNLDIQQKSYDKLKNGPTALDIKSYQLSIASAQASLADTQSQLSNYIITSPIDGVIANLPASVGNDITNGTTLVSIVSPDSIAELTFNEIDVAKIKIGQKATLTFDAIPDLNLTGEVIDIDTLGTVSQGVVSYTVKIAFDTNDSRIMPGMSVNADVVITANSDVLLVPNAAIKTSTSDGSSYVQVFPDNKSTGTITSSTPPVEKTVEVGLSNDSYTEITSGLNEGDLVVVKTTIPTTTSKTSGSSLLPVGGANRSGFGGGTGNMRSSGAARIGG